jgi:hypothetical protein
MRCELDAALAVTIVPPTSSKDALQADQIVPPDHGGSGQDARQGLSPGARIRNRLTAVAPVVTPPATSAFAASALIVDYLADQVERWKATVLCTVARRCNRESSPWPT